MPLVKPRQSVGGRKRKSWALKHKGDETMSNLKDYRVYAQVTVKANYPKQADERGEYMAALLSNAMCFKKDGGFLPGSATWAGKEIRYGHADVRINGYKYEAMMDTQVRAKDTVQAVERGGLLIGWLVEARSDKDIIPGSAKWAGNDMAYVGVEELNT